MPRYPAHLDTLLSNKNIVIKIMHLRPSGEDNMGGGAPLYTREGVVRAPLFLADSYSSTYLFSILFPEKPSEWHLSCKQQ